MKKELESKLKEVRERMATYSAHKRNVLSKIANKVFNAKTDTEVTKYMKEYRKAQKELE